MVAIVEILAKASLIYAKNWAQKEARPRGRFIGNPPIQLPVEQAAVIQAGYGKDALCFLFIEAAENPRFYEHDSGNCYKPELNLISDGRSGPGIISRIPKEYADLEPFGTRLKAWLPHDSTYKNRGIWWKPNRDAEEWLWLPLTRKQADMLLFQHLCSAGAKKAEVRAVYAAVRAFGGKAWKRHRERERQTT